MPLVSQNIEASFAACFLKSHHTILCGGFSEPEYIPSMKPSAELPHRIHYTKDYLASALHETAHWCIAGPERRQLKDYGYFYESGTRNLRAQKKFMVHEVRPQAVEAMFHEALLIPFQVSLDALHFEPAIRKTLQASFEQEVEAELARVCIDPPYRAKVFYQRLRQYTE
jgi:elongation factor P hydroxylase